MAMKKSGLGRGLDGLFPSYVKKDTEEEVSEKKTKDSSSAKGKTTARKTDTKAAGKKTGAKKSASKKTTETVPVADEEKAENKPELKEEEKQTKEVLPENEAAPEAEKKDETGIRMMRVSDIEPNPDQPRKTFNEDALEELAESFKLHGVVQPLIVVKRGDYYMIVAGERRWRAAKIAGLKEVPVLVAEYTDREVMEISLIENIQREDLDPIEEAQAFRRLIEEFDLKQDEVAERVSRSRTAVTNSLRLLKLDPRVQQMVIEDKISV